MFIYVLKLFDLIFIAELKNAKQVITELKVKKSNLFFWQL